MPIDPPDMDWVWRLVGAKSGAEHALVEAPAAHARDEERACGGGKLASMTLWEAFGLRDSLEIRERGTPDPTRCIVVGPTHCEKADHEGGLAGHGKVGRRCRGGTKSMDQMQEERSDVDPPGVTIALHSKGPNVV